MCKRINVNLDIVDIVDSNIIQAGESLFAVAFAESRREEGYFSWDNWISVYQTVTIKAYTFESLSKGGIDFFEYKSDPIEYEVGDIFPIIGGDQ